MPCTSWGWSEYKTSRVRWKENIGCLDLVGCASINNSSDQQNRRRKNETKLPKREETNNPDSHRQLEHEDGVNLQRDEHFVRFRILFIFLFFFSLLRCFIWFSHLSDESPPDGLIIPGKLGLHLRITWGKKRTYIIITIFQLHHCIVCRDGVSSSPAVASW